MKILVIGAHLDDIELACGGTIARASAAGHEIKMLVMSGSAYANYDGKVLRTVDEALAEGKEAASTLGVEDLIVMDFDTKDIPYHSTVIEPIDRTINDFHPDIIFTHWSFDTHQAHQGVSLSTISAARRCNSVLMYEPIAPSGRSYMAFRPQVYIDISEHIEAKIESLRAHKSQLKKYGEDWLGAVRARATHRGYEMGTKCAEAFEVLRYELKV